MICTHVGTGRTITKDNSQGTVKEQCGYCGELLQDRQPEVTSCKHETSIFTETMDGAKSYFCRNCGKSLPAEQPAPIPNAHPASWSLVIADMAQRDVFGAGKYNTRLQPHNGRDTLTDAYQEALDLAVYLRTAIFERDGK